MSSQKIVDLRKKTPGSDFIPVRFAHAPARQSTLRAKKRKIRVVIAVFVLTVIGISVYGISWASYLPQYNVQRVDVVGTQAVASGVMRAYVETLLQKDSYPLLSPRNIFLFSPRTIEQDIMRYFPRIKSAKVSRASLLSTGIQVDIQERQPFALWCESESNCFLLDDAGFVFAQATSSSQTSSHYVFLGDMPEDASSTSPIAHSYASAHFQGLLALLRYLGQAGFSPQGAHIVDDRDFTVPLAEGFYIRASFGEDASAVAKNLKLVLTSDALQGKESELEYVDLRFGNRVYYKLQGGEEMPS
ncbi:FtsQ-type POTRA domain-containing protein [Candidatus Kaiserbacteria bacterium]|nr:FtsQ-type POTRA domain-containing protein [Candidatus Kaiserbacteria bacterium]